MIGKQTFGDNFRGCLDYVLTKPGARFLASNMVGTTPAHLAIEFNLLAKRNQRVKYPVCHISLSPHPDDYLEDNQTLALVGRCLEDNLLTWNQIWLSQHQKKQLHKQQARHQFQLDFISRQYQRLRGRGERCIQFISLFYFAEIY